MRWWQLGLIWLGLRLISFGIEMTGVGRTYRFLGRLSPRPRSDASLPQAKLAEIGRLVNRASRGLRGYCLRRSLLIWWWLRWHHCDSEIFCEMGLSKGHAWLEVGGMVVGDRLDLAGRGQFLPFSQWFSKRGEH